MNGKPIRKPARPWFSSGPCAKRPGWTPTIFERAFTARSHRVLEGQARIREVIELSRRVLSIPDNFKIAVTPGSDTGAVEMALWNFLGPRGVDVCCWENFGFTWLADITEQLGLSDVRVHRSERYGGLPDLSKVDCDRDVVFAWNGTTSGVRVPDADWIKAPRQGLTICDATSAVFAMEVDFSKLDVVTWSWQKGMGGEGGHGMLALSPAAVARLRNAGQVRGLPKLFRLTKSGHLDEALFQGVTINTPSMIAVEDAIDALTWCLDIGGLDTLLARSRANLDTIAAFVEGSHHVSFLAEDQNTVSSSSICLKFVHEAFTSLGPSERRAYAERVCTLVEADAAGFDIRGHREAPPSLRLWGGPTVDREDLELLCPWIEWACEKALSEIS